MGFIRSASHPAESARYWRSPPFPPGSLTIQPGAGPFQLDFTFAGKAYCLNTSTGPGGCFQVEDTPLDDGTGRTIADLLAQGRPDFPWSGNDFPITIRERPVPGSHLEADSCGQWLPRAKHTDRPRRLRCLSLPPRLSRRPCRLYPGFLWVEGLLRRICCPSGQSVCPPGAKRPLLRGAGL